MCVCNVGRSEKEDGTKLVVALRIKLREIAY